MEAAGQAPEGQETDGLQQEYEGGAQQGAEDGEAAPPSPSARPGASSFPTLNRRLLTIRSSYYRPELEGEETSDIGEEGASEHSGVSLAGSSVLVGPLASGDGGLGWRLLPPRIAPTANPAPPLPFLTHALSGGAGRSGVAKAAAASEEAVAVREMGERLTRLEDKLDSLLARLVPG